MSVEKLKLGMSGFRFWGVIRLWVEAELVGVKEVTAVAMSYAVVTVATYEPMVTTLAAMSLVHQQGAFRFFILTLRVKEIVRRASFSNP